MKVIEGPGGETNDEGRIVASVELSATEVYAAIALFAVEKHFGKGVKWADPGYSVSVFPEALASFVVLGRSVAVQFIDGYRAVELQLLAGPKEGA